MAAAAAAPWGGPLSGRAPPRAGRAPQATAVRKQAARVPWRSVQGRTRPPSGGAPAGGIAPPPAASGHAAHPLGQIEQGGVVQAQIAQAAHRVH